jgi:hypothetical protein
MNDFFDRTVRTQAETEGRIAEVGGLPVITEAASGLREALDQTRSEIEAAVFAERFPRTVSDNAREFLKEHRLSPEAMAALELEGEAGLKRVELLSELRTIEGSMSSLVHRLITLRADLYVSRSEGTGFQATETGATTAAAPTRRQRAGNFLLKSLRAMGRPETVMLFTAVPNELMSNPNSYEA